MKFGRLFWGIIILCVGVILLGVNFGWWDNSVWLRVLDLWPLFLVVVGIGIIFGNNSPVGLILLLLVIAFGVAYVANYKNLRNRLGRPDSISVSSQNFSRNLDTEVKNAKMTFDLGAADIQIGALDDKTKLYQGSFNSSNDMVNKYSLSNGTATILFSEEFKHFSTFFNERQNREFSIDLSKTIPLNLKFNLGASKMNMDLSALKVENLEISAGASTSEIKIGKEVEKVSIDISAGASKTTIKVPSEYALFVESDSALTDHNFDQFYMTKTGKSWKTGDWETNQKQIRLKLSAGASTIQLERY